VNSKAERSIRTKSAVSRYTNPRHTEDLHVEQNVLVDRKRDTETEEGRCGRITQPLHSSVSVRALFQRTSIVAEKFRGGGIFYSIFENGLHSAH
jgi:hypothetical protein